MKKIFLSAIVIIGFISYSLLINLKKNDDGLRIKTSPKPKVVQVLPTITTSPVISVTQPIPQGIYRDGKYNGIAANAVYGNVQVQIEITNGSFTSVRFLQYPNDQYTSNQINIYADPILAQEAIAQQTANVDIVSSATLTSKAFIESLQSALVNAK